MKKFTLLFIALASFSIPNLNGALFDSAGTQTQTQPNQTAQQAQTTSTDQAAANPDLTVSAAVAQSWLKGVDNEKYEQSWDQEAKQAQNVIKKEEWKQVLDAVRKPLGSVVDRKLLDQRTAKDPKGLVPGDYMVLFYKTKFQNKDSSYELITLQKEADGQWRVLTYQVQ